MINNKQTIIANVGRHKADTGSPEVQVAILSERIAEITEHLKKKQARCHSKKKFAQDGRRQKKTFRIFKKAQQRRF